MVTRGVRVYNPDDEFFARQALSEGQAYKKNQNKNQRGHHHQPPINDDDYVELVDVQGTTKNGTPPEQVAKSSSSTKSKHRRSSSGITKTKKSNPSTKTTTSSSSTRGRQSSSRSTTKQKEKNQQRKRKKIVKKVEAGDESSISSNPFDIVDDDDISHERYDTEEDEGLGVIFGCDQRDDIDDDLLADNPTAAGCAVAAGDMILGKLLDDGTTDGDLRDGGDGSTNFGSGYFSLDYSNQDSSYTKPTVLNTTTEDLGATYAAMFEDESNFIQAVVEMKMVPPPLSPAEIKDLENAFAGDYYRQNHDHALAVEKNVKNKTAVDDTGEANYDVETKISMIVLPYAKDFEQRAETIGSIDSLQIESRKRRYRFLVPFILKAELNPGLAFGECLVTFVHGLCAYSLFFHGFSFMISVIGGLSLFVALTITHFWYGFCRYPSLWNNHVPPGLEGIQMDQNFDEIRDVCSYHYNDRSDVNPQQMTSFLLTVPFTIIYHLSGFLFTSIFHGVTGIGTNDEIVQKRIVPSPITASIHASNFLVMMISSFGGPYGLIYATLVVHFNQAFYNSLLFRRKVRDFILSIFLGNLLIIHKKDDQRKQSAVNDQGAVQKDCVFLEMEEGNRKVKEKSKNSHSEPPSKSNFPSADMTGRESKQQSEETKAGEIAMSIDKGRAVVKTATYKNDNVRSNSDRGSPSKNVEVSPSVGDKHGDISSSRLNPDEFVLAAPVRSRVMDSEGFTSVKISKSAVNDAPPEKVDEWLNPSDVHIHIDNHPGTIAWKNIIAESIQRFPVKSYTFRKHNWVMRKMRGRNFYSKENGMRVTQLRRSRVKKYCKDHHDKQVEIQKQIVNILSDLSDVKKGSEQNIRDLQVLRPSQSGAPKDAKDEVVAMEEQEMARAQVSSSKVSVDDAELSSSETISTLTHSQIHSEIHSPPAGEEEEETSVTKTKQSSANYFSEAKCENELSESSENLTKTMYGVTSYSSLLDNLQKLSGDSPRNSDHQRVDDHVVAHRNEIEPTLAMSQASAFRETKNPQRLTEKAFSQKKSEGTMQINSLPPSSDKQTTTTLQAKPLNKQKDRAFNGGLKPKQRIPLFRPLWKRALQKKNESDQKSRNESPEKRKQSIWKRQSNPPPKKLDLPVSKDMDTNEPEINDSLPDALSMPTGSKESTTFEAILSMLDIVDEDSRDSDVYGQSNSASTDMHSSGTWTSDGLGSDLRYYEEEMSDFHLAPQQHLKDICNAAPSDNGTFGVLTGACNPLSAFPYVESHSTESSTDREK